MVNIKYKIILAFSFIVLLLAATGLFLIQSMESLAKETENIYRHPFAVSNATRDIRVYILSTQNHLTEIMLSRNDETFGILVEKIRLNENRFRKQFERISERFLGDQKDVKTMLDAFTQWQEIYESIISAKREGMTEKAMRIMHGQLPKSTAQLESAIQFLADFANAKANEFYTLTLERKKGSLVMFTSLLTLTIVGSKIF